jgi:hypothetical protein
MQHTWAVNDQDLRESQVGWKAQLKSIFVNRLAAVKAGYMTIEEAEALFKKNHAPHSTTHAFDIALGISNLTKVKIDLILKFVFEVDLE